LPRSYCVVPEQRALVCTFCLGRVESPCVGVYGRIIEVDKPSCINDSKLVLRIVLSEYRDPLGSGVGVATGVTSAAGDAAPVGGSCKTAFLFLLLTSGQGQQKNGR
jgi:hypothetical protein